MEGRRGRFIKTEKICTVRERSREAKKQKKENIKKGKKWGLHAKRRRGFGVLRPGVKGYARGEEGRGREIGREKHWQKARSSKAFVFFRSD